MFNSIASSTLIFSLSVVLWIPAHSHGYTTISRNFKCVDASNFQCGLIQYEPQSLEAPKGFPGSGPPDGQLASAGLPRFSPLDEQTPFRWLKTKVEPGPYEISWKFTAAHATTGYEYFMTRPDWNPSAALARSSFDLNPFCVVEEDGTPPPIEGVTHSCVLPQRSGYQIILAVWTIANTANAFYNVNDVLFPGDNGPPVPVSAIPTTAPVNAPPSPPSSTGTLCSSGLPLDSIDQCTGFVHCDNYAVVPNSKVLCSDGLLFSTVLQNCDWAYSVDCDIPPGPIGVPSSPPAAAPSSVPPPTNGDLCSQGLSLVPVDGCTAFVFCVGGVEVSDSRVECANGLLFHYETQQCDWSYNVDCDFL